MQPILIRTIIRNHLRALSPFVTLVLLVGYCGEHRLQIDPPPRNEPRPIRQLSKNHVAHCCNRRSAVCSRPLLIEHAILLLSFCLLASPYVRDRYGLLAKQIKQNNRFDLKGILKKTLNDISVFKPFPLQELSRYRSFGCDIEQSETQA